MHPPRSHRRATFRQLATITAALLCAGVITVVGPPPAAAAPAPVTASSPALAASAMAVTTTGDFAGYQNLAYGASTAMSKTAYSGHEAKNTVDGDPSTYAQEAAGAIFDLELGLTDRVRFNAAVIGLYDKRYPITRFRLSAKDGDTWAPLADRAVADAEKSAGSIVERLAEPTSGDAVKLEILAGSRWLSVSEVEIYDTTKLRAVTANYPTGSKLTSGTTVTLQTLDEGATIHYTTDGSPPAATSTPYSGPIPITAPTVITAIAVADGRETSEVVSFSYTIRDPATYVPIANPRPSVSSLADTGTSAAAAIDGDITTSWRPDVIGAEKNEARWITLDFGASYDIAGMDITWPEENGKYTYLVEVSDNDIAYYPYYRGDGTSTERLHSIDLKDSHRRYARIRITGSNGGKTIGVSEWTVYGTRNTTATPEQRMPTSAQTGDFDRVVVNAIPASIPAVTNPKISLNGAWRFTMTPQNAFWENDADTSSWATATIPGNLDHQGFPVYLPGTPTRTGIAWADTRWWPGNNGEMAYKQQIDVPADYTGQNVFLRVDKAFSYARIWVNGTFVREHRGEYNAFDVDITDYVTPGAKNWVTIAITAEGNSLEGVGLLDAATASDYESRYKANKEGYGFLGLRHDRGILGDVTLFAAPKTHLNRLHVETDFDDDFQNATLKVTASAGALDAGTAQVDLTLTDPQGNPVALPAGTLQLAAPLTDVSVANTVTTPAKWDAEHPNLYTLTATVKTGTTTVETLSKKVGFRELSTTGGVFKVNNVPTKLRGVNFLTQYGTDVAYDFARQKIYLEELKENNINFIRAAHFPLSTETLDWADANGIYVEQENSITFVGEFGDHAKNDANYTDYFQHTASEMVEKDRSHPSVIIWSLGNESRWGSNFQAEGAYVKADDRTRPTIFSWGGRYWAPAMESGNIAPADFVVDILSQHYRIAEDGLKYMNRTRFKNMPVLWDEYAHGFLDTSIGDLQQDPGLRETYYATIKRDWEEVYANDRHMGGAIWNFVDWYTEGKNQVDGIGDWGQVDVWGREKPEIYGTKNVYSPVQYKGADAAAYPAAATGALTLPYENRYETVNFADADFAAYATINNGQRTKITAELAPRATGNLAVPAPTDGWKYGDTVKLEFEKTTNGRTVNVVTNIITIGSPTYVFAQSGAETAAPAVTDTDTEITVKGTDFDVTFDKTTGQITTGNSGGKTLLTGGPHLNLGRGYLQSKNTAQTSSATTSYLGLGTWKLESISSTTQDRQAVVTITGTYTGTAPKTGADPIVTPVTFTLAFDGQGKIVSGYTIDTTAAAAYLSTLTTSGSTQVQAYEAGVAFDLAPEAESVTWDRDGYFSYYPNDQYGLNSGTASKEVDYQRQWGVRPSMPWKFDDKDFYNFGDEDKGGRGTNDFRGSKTNVHYAQVDFTDTDAVVNVEGNGNDSVRAAVNADRTVRLNVNSGWGFPANSSLNQTPYVLKTDTDGRFSSTVAIRLSSQDALRYPNYESANAAQRIALTQPDGRAAINTDKGTLDFDAQTGTGTTTGVTWSVVGLDGKPTTAAIVSTGGTLTAIANGYVVVKATAADSTGATGAAIIRITGQSTTATTWSAQTQYAAGTLATYNGAIYKSQWQTRNQQPGLSATGPWAELGAQVFCDNGTHRAWTASAVYIKGDLIVQDTTVFEAQWWTRNQKPGDPTGPWSAKGACHPDDASATWSPTTIYHQGDLVTHNGHQWRAKWWTRNQEPGDPNGPWEDTGPSTS
ncbi:glycoside hydrolase family 2 TIM barrel-domain containing protein [Actinoplanes sp. CA-131856]